MAKVKITNNIVSNSQNSRTDIYSNNGISVNGSSIIDNNNIDGYYRLNGVEVRSDSIVTNNKISLYNSSNGVYVIGSATNLNPVLIENNFISGNISSNGVVCTGNSSYSINNNKISSFCQDGVSVGSSQYSNIIGNTIKNFSRDGVSFISGNLQSNIISRDNSASINSFVNSVSPTLQLSGLVVDNIFSHQDIVNGGSKDVVKINGNQKWIVERNIPTYNTAIQDQINNLLTLISSTSETTYQPIEADENHVLWYSCDWSSYTESSNQILSDRVIFEGSGLSVVSSSSSSPDPVSSLHLGSTPKINLLGKSYAYTPSALNISSYNFVENGFSLEMTMRQGALLNQEVPLIQIVNFLPSNIRRRVSLNVENNLNTINGLSFTYNRGGVYDNSGNDHTIIFPHVNLFEKTHLMMTIKPVGATAEMNIYVNGSQVYSSSAIYDTTSFNSTTADIAKLFQNADGDYYFNQMLLYVGTGEFSTTATGKKYKGSISDIRLSNTVRDQGYAVRAYKDAIKL